MEYKSLQNIHLTYVLICNITDGIMKSLSFGRELLIYWGGGRWWKLENASGRSVVTDFWIRADGDSPRFPPGFCKARSPLVVTTLIYILRISDQLIFLAFEIFWIFLKKSNGASTITHISH